MDAGTYMGLVAGLGCVVCRNVGLGETPAVVHHIREGQGGAQRAADFLTIPLCPEHHTGDLGFHTNRRAFVMRFGEELDLLAQTIKDVAGAIEHRRIPCM